MSDPFDGVPTPESISFTITGNPISQGSMNQSRTGHMYHRNSTQLNAWRNQILAGALQTAHAAGWTLPLDEPVEIWAEFRLKKPGRPKFTEYPAVTPDLDKLARAVGDALSPTRGHKVLKDDSRIIGWYLHKNYGQPGVTITITRGTSLRPKRAIWTDQTVPF